MTSRVSRLVPVLSTVVLVAAAGLSLTVGSGANAQPAGDKPAAQPGGERGGERGRQPGGPRGEGGERRPDGGGPGNLEGAMKSMNRPVRALMAQITDASKKEENLKLLGQMQRGCVAAKDMPVPEELLKEAKDDAAKAKLAETFRRDLLGVLKLLVEAEQAVLDGKGDEAKSKLEAVIKAKAAGHKDVGVKEEQPGPRGPRGG